MKISAFDGLKVNKQSGARLADGVLQDKEIVKKWESGEAVPVQYLRYLIPERKSGSTCLITLYEDFYSVEFSSDSINCLEIEEVFYQEFMEHEPLGSSVGKNGGVISYDAEPIVGQIAKMHEFADVRCFDVEVKDYRQETDVLVLLKEFLEINEEDGKGLSSASVF